MARRRRRYRYRVILAVYAAIGGVPACRSGTLEKRHGADDTARPGAAIRAVQLAAPPSYDFEVVGDGVFEGEHFAHQRRIRIDRDGVAWTTHDGREELRLGLARAGCDGTLDPVASVTPVSGRNLVTYSRPGIDEWYVSGPLGVEQGFLVKELPACAAAQELVLEVRVAGRELKRTPHGAVRLLARGAGPAYRIQDLFVSDANGTALAARMDIDRDRLLIRVDARGAALPIDVDPLVTVEEQKLLRSPATRDHQFGWSVALSGNTAVLGELEPDVSILEPASVHVFVRSAGAWTEQATLSEPQARDFGRRMAVSGDTLVATAPHEGAGSAYVFVRSGSTWSRQARLTAGDAEPFDSFGGAVSLSGNTLLVGANGKRMSGKQSVGAVYVFVRSGSTWTQEAKLVAGDADAYDGFGVSVAVSGDTALVGATGEDPSGVNYAGSAYAFVRTGSTWTEQAKLVATDPQAGGFFGSVALEGDTALIGAYGQSKAYVFTREGSSWSKQAQLDVVDTGPNDEFGYGVSLSGDMALVGAPTAPVAGGEDYAGSVYVFMRWQSKWTISAKLTPSDSHLDDRFGRDVALSGETALVGAFLGDAGPVLPEVDAGSAYIFSLVYSGVPGEPCNDGTDCALGFCVEGVCCDAGCGGDELGDCRACSIAAGAVADGTCTPLAAGTECRVAAGPCDEIDACDGASTECPADAFVRVGTACRVSAGDCDVEETCTGASVVCPSDARAPAGVECRADAGECDVAEACDSVSSDCPNDAFARDGSPCSHGSCVAGVCEDSSGTGGTLGSGGAGGTGGAGPSGAGGTVGTSSGAGGSAGTTGSAASGGTRAASGEDSGCGCAFPRSETKTHPLLLVGVGALAVARRRRATASQQRRRTCADPR